MAEVAVLCLSGAGDFSAGNGSYLGKEVRPSRGSVHYLGGAEVTSGCIKRTGHHGVGLGLRLQEPPLKNPQPALPLGTGSGEEGDASKRRAVAAADVEFVDGGAVGEAQEIHHGLGDVVGVQELGSDQIGAGLGEHVCFDAAGENRGDADVRVLRLGRTDLVIPMIACLLAV